MENKNVGYMLLGITILIIVIIFLFNSTLKDMVKSSCTGEHSLSCPMYSSINQQTYLALSIAGIIVIIALVMIFSKPQERIVIKKFKEERKKINIADLRPDEVKVLKKIQEHKTVFQADLIEETGLGKAKISRILDRLQGKGIVERKRRGMTNVIVYIE